MQVQLIETYKETKAEVKDAEKWVTQYQAELEKTEAYRLLEQAKAQLDIVKSELKVADDNLRWITLDGYEQTGDKNPCPGLKIVINTKLSYDDFWAIKWAFTNAFSMLTLKKSSFEKEARQLLGTSQELDFVQTTKEASVRIGKDL